MVMSAIQWYCLLYMSTVMHRAGVYMMMAVSMKGKIDDLSQIYNDLPIGKYGVGFPVPSHELDVASLHHLVSQIKYIYNDKLQQQIMNIITPKIINISPEYLLKISQQIDLIDKEYQINKLGSLTQDFSNTLNHSFLQLSHFLSLYQEDNIMKDSSFLKLKFNLELYILQKISQLIKKDNSSLGNTIQTVASHLSQYFEDEQRLIFLQRQAKQDYFDKEKDKIIFGLRRQIGIKRQYTAQLQERIHELENQNSNLYTKLILNAKNTSDFAKHSSPAKIKQLFNTTSLNLSLADKLTSPKKKITYRFYEEEVLQILQSKQKQQSIQERYSSLDEYIHKYFTMKYGKILAEQNQYSFREAIGIFAKNQEKHIFILFQAILQEECQEGYFGQYKSFYEKIVKNVKRYLNERYGKSLYDLDRLFDHKNVDEKNDVLLSQADIEPILANIYRSSDIKILRMILSQLLASKMSSGKLNCKKLINQILNYELNTHIMRVEDIIREARRIAEGNRTLTFEQLQKVMIKLIKQQNKYGLLRNDASLLEKTFTMSEVIQMIHKIRNTKIMNKDKSG